MAVTWLRSLVEGPSSGMLFWGDDTRALAVRVDRGFEVAAAPLAVEPATLPGIVVVDALHMNQMLREGKQRKAEPPQSNLISPSAPSPINGSRHVMLRDGDLVFFVSSLLL